MSFLYTKFQCSSYFIVFIMNFSNFRWRPFWKWRSSWIFFYTHSDRLIMFYLYTKFKSSSYFIVFIMIFSNFRWRPFWKWRPSWKFFKMHSNCLFMVYLYTKFQSSGYFIVFIMNFSNFRWRPFWKWRPCWKKFFSIDLPLMMVHFCIKLVLTPLERFSRNSSDKTLLRKIIIIIKKTFVWKNKCEGLSRIENVVAKDILICYWAQTVTSGYENE